METILGGFLIGLLGSVVWTVVRDRGCKCCCHEEGAPEEEAGS